MKKIAILIAGGVLMMGGDYLAAYYDAVWIFFLGELFSLFGWVAFVLALEK